MKTQRVVHILMIVAVGLLGLAPAVVCAMPPTCPPAVGGECPMTQSPAAAHDCCEPAGQAGLPADGVAAAPCHAVTVAPSIAPPSTLAALLTSIPLSAVLFTVRPSTALRTDGVDVFAASPPRFLLTHAFRL
jgi:hypothetical protein